LSQLILNVNFGYRRFVRLVRMHTGALLRIIFIGLLSTRATGNVCQDMPPAVSLLQIQRPCLGNLVDDQGSEFVFDVGCRSMNSSSGCGDGRVSSSATPSFRVYNLHSLPTPLEESSYPESSEFLLKQDTSDTVQQKYQSPCLRNLQKKIHTIWVFSSLPHTKVAAWSAIALKNQDWKIIVWMNRNFLEHTKRDFQKSAQAATNIEFRSIEDSVSRFRYGSWILNQINPAGLSDILRLEVVNLEGGIYTDSDSKAVRRLSDFVTKGSKSPIFERPFVVFDALNNGTLGNYGNLCNCMFGDMQNGGLSSFALDVLHEQAHEQEQYQNSIHGQQVSLVQCW